VLRDYEDVADYLLRRGWIDDEMVLAGNLELVDRSRRNANFEVRTRQDRGYFLKQETRHAAGDLIVGTVGYEAAVYELLTTLRRGTLTCSYLPRRHAFDPVEQVLVLEGLVGWITLTQHYLRRRRSSATIAARLAEALADLHELTAAERGRMEGTLGSPDQPPWAFLLTEPDHSLSLNSSSASIELVRVLQQSEELVAAFELLRQGWRNTAFVHGDIKWDNCLVSASTASHRTLQIKIVDWEMARLGDPCWDVGAVFGGHLAAWLASIPVSAGDAPDRFLELARFPLARMKPALRTFWRVYCKRLKIPPADVGDSLVRAVSFAGVRLVQTAFEQLQGETELTPSAVLLVQLCANIVDRPVEAAVQLLGIPIPEHVHDQLALP
jgi:phosphotransferase family enzyme